MSGSICENGAGTMVQSVNGEVLRWLSETAARMEEDGGGARSCWTREEDGVAVRGAEKLAALRGGSSWWSDGADSGELTMEGAAMAEARGRRTRSMAAA